MTTPPKPFEALKYLADNADAGARAQEVGAALNAVPELQKWLRRLRQDAVLDLRADGLSHAEVGKVIGTSRARAQQIAEGRTTGRRAPGEVPEEDSNPGT
ncbi:RNA polymerase subunit sigma-70 [Streptomyces goshikiensis]|uniref:RNA polymerase subunit sigma-70 n=1 Tax=Streptomyces goshikiensis TaxID=1942 RepID=UPI0037237715